MPLTFDQMVHKIHKMDPNQKYIVFQQQINVDSIDLKSLHASMNNAGCIFNNGKQRHNDKKRKQKSENDLSAKHKRQIKPIGDQIAALFRAVHPDGKAKLSGVSVLQSLPGCARQQPHYDFDYGSNPSDSKQSFLVLLAIEDGTNIVVFTKKGSKVVQLNKGDLFIGQGDLIHAGGAYEALNIRLHWYVDYGKKPREMGKTYSYDLLTATISVDDYYDKKRKADTVNLTHANAANKRRRDFQKEKSRQMSERFKKVKV